MDAGTEGCRRMEKSWPRIGVPAAPLASFRPRLYT